MLFRSFRGVLFAFLCILFTDLTTTDAHADTINYFSDRNSVGKFNQKWKVYYAKITCDFGRVRNLNNREFLKRLRGLRYDATGVIPLRKKVRSYFQAFGVQNMDVFQGVNADSTKVFDIKAGGGEQVTGLNINGSVVSTIMAPLYLADLNNGQSFESEVQSFCNRDFYFQFQGSVPLVHTAVLASNKGKTDAIKGFLGATFAIVVDVVKAVFNKEIADEADATRVSSFNQNLQEFFDAFDTNEKVIKSHRLKVGTTRIQTDAVNITIKILDPDLNWRGALGNLKDDNSFLTGPVPFTKTTQYYIDRKDEQSLQKEASQSKFDKCRTIAANLTDYESGGKLLSEMDAAFAMLVALNGEEFTVTHDQAFNCLGKRLACKSLEFTRKARAGAKLLDSVKSRINPNHRFKKITSVESVCNSLGPIVGSSPTQIAADRIEKSNASAKTLKDDLQVVRLIQGFSINNIAQNKEIVAQFAEELDNSVSDDVKIFLGNTEFAELKAIQNKTEAEVKALEKSASDKHEEIKTLKKEEPLDAEAVVAAEKSSAEAVDALKSKRKTELRMADFLSGWKLDGPTITLKKPIRISDLFAGFNTFGFRRFGCSVYFDSAKFPLTFTDGSKAELKDVFGDLKDLSNVPNFVFLASKQEPVGDDGKPTVITEVDAAPIYFKHRNGKTSSVIVSKENSKVSKIINASKKLAIASDC